MYIYIYIYISSAEHDFVIPSSLWAEILQCLSSKRRQKASTKHPGGGKARQPLSLQMHPVRQTPARSGG